MAEVPKSKPITEDQFKNELDLTAKIIFNKTLPRDDLRITLQEKIKKAEDKGIMSSEEALSFVKDRIEFFKEYSKENPMGDAPPKNFQMGGRVNFLKYSSANVSISIPVPSLPPSLIYISVTIALYFVSPPFKKFTLPPI